MERLTKLEDKQNPFLQLSSPSAAVSHINNGKITINNSYPPSTTFIQADTSSFKQVVQFLTGSSKHATKSSHNSVVDPVSKSTIPPIKNKPKKQGLNLFERRNNSFKNTIRINPFTPGSNFNQKQNSGFSPRDSSKNIELLSPSILNFPSLVLSPVTPLLHQDSFNRSASTSTISSPVVDKEDKEIAEKGFYLHPSSSPSIPNTPRDSEPQLLSLFPLTSPRFSGSPTNSCSSSS